MQIGIDIGHNISYDTGASGVGFKDELNALVGNELIKKLKAATNYLESFTPLG
jgi:N-acetylmuramoyl-L-alanine amidase